MRFGQIQGVRAMSSVRDSVYRDRVMASVGLAWVEITTVTESRTLHQDFFPLKIQSIVVAIF